EKMKTRFGLCQIYQVLGNAFLLQRVLYHFAITSATLQCVLQRLPSTTGKIVDIARYWIGQHERKIGMSGFDLSFRPCFDVGVDWRGDLIGFINRSGLGLLLR